MRLFGSYRCPMDEEYVDGESDCQGDIDSNDYLFLGDFVDRGTNRQAIHIPHNMKTSIII